jgi:uncharacterized protein YndB with AHSA1/START domain
MSSPQTVSVRITRHYQASPERVFDAWIDPAKVAQWFLAPARSMGMGEDELLAIEVDARVGGKFLFSVRRMGEVVDHVGEYLEIDRPRRLAFTWAVPKYSPDSTVVRLELSPSGAGTELTLTHEGVLAEYRPQTEKGWTAISDAVAASVGG